MPNKIILAGDPIQKEGIASEKITPGMLVELGGSDDYQKHSSEGENASPKFADANAQWGEDIDDDVSSGDQVQVKHCRPGDEVYALLDSDSSNVSKGDLLESAGNGNLTDYTAQAVDEGGSDTYTIYENRVVARALEDVDSPTSGNARIKVEVI